MAESPARIVVEAAGVVTPIGQDLEAFWSALVTGASGISQIDRFRVDDLRVGRGGEIKKLAPLRGRRRVPESRASRLLIAAAEDLRARVDLGAIAPSRLGVVVGTALGGVEEGERALAGDPRRRPLADALYDAPAHDLARWIGGRGPTITVSTACASGATAIAVGADLLRAGEVDAVVAGGYDVLCRFVMRGFNALRALTRDEVRPFDRRRSGLLLGEAAALVLLRREPDAAGPGLGAVLGYGSASDAAHISAPDPDGRGLERAVRAALAEAGLAAEAIDLVSAHGTGTLLNDPIEAAVIARVLGPRAGVVPVNSIKPSLGHTMGAAAVLEALMCLLASRHGLVPPTLHLDEPDPACALDHVRGAARAVRPRIALSTSLGFGGCNAALVLEGGGVMRGPALRGLGFLSAWGAGAPAWPDDARAAAAGRAVVACARPPRDEARFRRATREGLLALDAVEAALEDGGASREAIAGDRTGLLYVTGAAYARSNRRFIDGTGGGSIHFAETAPAVVPAEVAIELGLSGPYAIFIGGPPATLRAVQHGAGLLEAGACDRALVLAVEIFDECADLYQRGRRPGAPPLVEAAACLWLEPGQGALRVVSGRGDAARAARGLAAVRRRLGETFCCEPLGALDLWRRQDPAGTLALAGRWRGETARLTWTNVMAAARGSAT